MQIANLCLCLAGLSLACTGCQSQEKPMPTDLLAYFRPTAAADTLLFEVEHAEGHTEAIGDTVPNALFFSILDSALRSEITYVADSAEAVVLALRRFPLNADVDACLVDIRQHWFQHQSLLLYDRRRRVFADRVTVAEWYGGEGGQVLTGSWLLDYNGDGQKDLVRREIQHALRFDADGEAQDVLHESALLLLWREGRFVEQPMSDTSLIVKQFPIRSFW